MKRILCWLGFHKYRTRWDRPLWHLCLRCGHNPAPGPHIVEIVFPRRQGFQEACPDGSGCGEEAEG